MKNNCTLDLPYPQIKVERTNLNYAGLLSNDYAGNCSEMTAITQYFYQHLILHEKHEKIAETLECISIVEMHHLDMIGELIVKLGGDPLIRSTNCYGNVFWCGNNIFPTKNVRTLLEKNICAEKVAIRNYYTRILQIGDENIKKVLERIIKDEEYHVHLFGAMIDSLNE